MSLFAIARNTWLEAVRDRVFVLIGAFALVLLLGGVFISPLTIGAQQKILADLGLASVTAFSLLLILFVGAGSVGREADRRTLAVMLSKPLSRGEYLLGKYLGLMATLVALMAGMFALFVLCMVLMGGEIQAAYFVSAGLSALEVALLCAVALAFSTITGPVLTSLCTLGIFLAGRAITDLEAFAVVSGDQMVARAMGIAKWILPNLDLFDVRNAAVHGLPIETSHVL